jgi:prepilin-type N-terminal cleavage/methylation domain-containing protein
MVCDRTANPQPECVVRGAWSIAARDGRAARSECNRAPRTTQSGFSLIEVTVALTIGALVVLVAHQLFAAVAERGRTLITARAALDRAANARRWLAATFLSLDVGTDGAAGFEGRPDHVAFSTWLLTPEGWFERRQVTLSAEQGQLRAAVTPGAPIALMDRVADLELDYLLEPGADSRWVREWVSPVSAPVAVRMRLTKAGRGTRGSGRGVDTLLFLIKERG